MKIHKINTGNFKLDGGAMFGTIPKLLWNKVYPSDENNLCNLSMRCLLVELENRLILIDTGIGNKQDAKFFGYYYLNGNDSLYYSLKIAGFNKKDITDVILTHLHFDHCGGAVEKDKSGEFIPAFPLANYWISKPQCNWAMNPNQRERASFLNENIIPLFKSGRLKFIDNPVDFSNNIELRFFNGHTEGLMVPFITCAEKILVFVSDLVPTAAHVAASWICGYDTRPLISIDERNSFLAEAADNGYILFFEHDIYHECCTLKHTEKGVSLDKSFTLDKFLL